MQRTISLIHNGIQVGVVETTRQPHVGARYDNVQSGKIFRIAGWIKDNVAKVEVVPEETRSEPSREVKII